MAIITETWHKVCGCSDASASTGRPVIGDGFRTVVFFPRGPVCDKCHTPWRAGKVIEEEGDVGLRRALNKLRFLMPLEAGVGKINDIEVMADQIINYVLSLRKERRAMLENIKLEMHAVIGRYKKIEDPEKPFGF